MFPPVRHYGDINGESFEVYYARWPKTLSNIPRPVVEDWIHRHWSDFHRDWIKLRPQDWIFELSDFTSTQIHSIDHIRTWIPELDAEGVEFVGNAPRSRTRLAQYMLANGTFPVPIIVAKNAGHIIHPRSGGEHMKEPYQLIEGHSRLACIRGMINAQHPRLVATHNVWVVTIPPAASGANPSLKRSANGMPPGLVRGCAHIFHGPGLASCRWRSA
jgi:hypothetical protein